MRADAVARIPGWLPDALTASRLALLPAFLIAAEAARTGASASGMGSARAAALALLIAIAASDVLDGYFARRSARGPTRHGAILDAVADRTVQWAGVLLLTFRAEPSFTALPIWLAISLAVREALLVVAWLRTRARGGTTVEHELHGRVATVAVFATLIAAVWGLPGPVIWILAAGATGNVTYSAFRYAGRMAGVSPRSHRTQEERKR